MEVPATAGDLEALVLRSVLPDLLVADDTVSVRSHWEFTLDLPLPVGPAVDPHVLIELERGPDLHPACEVSRHLAVLSAASDDNQKLNYFFDENELKLTQRKLLLSGSTCKFSLIFLAIVSKFLSRKTRTIPRSQFQLAWLLSRTEYRSSERRPRPLKSALNTASRLPEDGL